MLRLLNRSARAAAALGLSSATTSRERGGAHGDLWFPRRGQATRREQGRQGSRLERSGVCGSGANCRCSPAGRGRTAIVTGLASGVTALPDRRGGRITTAIWTFRGTFVDGSGSVLWSTLLTVRQQRRRPAAAGGAVRALLDPRPPHPAGAALRRAPAALAALAGALQPGSACRWIAEQDIADQLRQTRARLAARQPRPLRSLGPSADTLPSLRCSTTRCRRCTDRLGFLARLRVPPGRTRAGVCRRARMIPGVSGRLLRHPSFATSFRTSAVVSGRRHLYQRPDPVARAGRRGSRTSVECANNRRCRGDSAARPPRPLRPARTDDAGLTTIADRLAGTPWTGCRRGAMELPAVGRLATHGADGVAGRLLAGRSPPTAPRCVSSTHAAVVARLPGVRPRRRRRQRAAVRRCCCGRSSAGRRSPPTGPLLDRAIELSGRHGVEICRRLGARRARGADLPPRGSFARRTLRAVIPRSPAQERTLARLSSRR